MGRRDRLHACVVRCGGCRVAGGPADTGSQAGVAADTPNGRGETPMPTLYGQLHLPLWSSSGAGRRVCWPRWRHVVSWLVGAVPTTQVLLRMPADPRQPIPFAGTRVSTGAASVRSLLGGAIGYPLVGSGGCATGTSDFD